MIKYKGQNYDNLKKHHQEEGTLFVDATFPAVNGIIGNVNIPANLEWKRPGDISKNPRLFTDIEATSLIRAGEFSCNWMVSAFATLAGVHEIRSKVVPDYWEQEWTLDKVYSGIFHFRFWRFGNWTDVVIDDLLPTVDNVLLTTQGGSENEFWPALVEKAYAKLHGSYEALREGELSDALVDFTGGVSEILDLRAGRYSELEEMRSILFDLLHKEMIEHNIICFSVSAPALSNIGERTELGLMKGHTYHMTEIKKVYLGETTLRSLFHGREKVAMVRLRDPRQEEKKPPGSPDSALSSDNPFAYSTDALSRLRSRNSAWQDIKDYERQRLGLVFRDPSEFWMPFEDVVVEFNEVNICRLVSENFFAMPGKKWKGSSVKGAWENGPKDTKMDKSGGGDIKEESFLKNPQFRIDLDVEEEIMIQLLQYQDEEPTVTNSTLHQLIGFHMLKVENNRKTRIQKIWPHQTLVVAEDHKRKREIDYRGQLSHGRYVIIPTTYREGDTANFLLRTFTQHNSPTLKELKDEVPKRIFLWSCFFPDIQWVTVLTVESAEIDTKIWGTSRINPYCEIQCENTKVKTEIVRENSEPEWNESFIFFRKRPQKPIIIKVFTKNALFPNQLLGECDLPAAVTHSPTPLDASIIMKQKTNDDAETVSAGVLHLKILTEDNLKAV